MKAVMSKLIRLALLSLWFTLPNGSIGLADSPNDQATSEVSLTYVCKSQGRASTLKVNETKQTLEWQGHTYKITETSCGRAGWHAERDGMSFDFCTATQGYASFKTTTGTVECDLHRD
jgi:hypothetical protein